MTASEAQLDALQGVIPDKSGTSSNDEKDCAWASVKVPLSKNACLALFRDNIELLFRINPLYEVEKWIPKGHDQFRLIGQNLSNDKRIVTDLTVNTTEQGIRIDYKDQLKVSTFFSIEDVSGGTKITLTENYAPVSTEEREARLGEVDKSLVPWARYLQEFLVNWKRWSWFAPWRWYTKKIWASMKPSARRITYMLLWITFAEIIAFLMVFTIFWFEMDKYF